MLQHSSSAAAASTNKVIIASSSGTSESGAPIITPVSVLTCKDSADGSEYQTRAADNIRLTINPVWSYSILGATIPAQSIFDHVPIQHALIRHWLKAAPEQNGGLVFPVPMLDMESLEPRVHIQRRTPPQEKQPLPSMMIYVDIHLHLFHRAMPAMEGAAELQPFDPAVWRADSYATWRHMHTDLAVVLEEEIEYSGHHLLPQGENQRSLFRRMMRAHFDDCGLVFGQIWHGFGLKTLLPEESVHTFMRGMLLEMFLSYHAKSTPSLPLPPCCNAFTVDPGQRICAQCLSFKLGSGLMMRCPCKTVSQL
jgi:hypothetical protein